MPLTNPGNATSFTGSIRVPGGPLEFSGGTLAIRGTTTVANPIVLGGLAVSLEVASCATATLAGPISDDRGLLGREAA